MPSANRHGFRQSTVNLDACRSSARERGLQCCRDPLMPMHSGTRSAATPDAIATSMSSDRLAIPQRWRPNWTIWSSPGSRGATASFALRASLAASPPSLARDHGDGREPTPKPGDLVMLLDGAARPRFIWRTTDVTIKPFSQVDETFAWDEGQGDRTRDWWLGVIAAISLGKPAVKGSS